MNKQLWFDQLRAAGVPVTWLKDIRDPAQLRFAVGWAFTPELLAKASNAGPTHGADTARLCCLRPAF
jgi:hypothetical protein